MLQFASSELHSRVFHPLQSEGRTFFKRLRTRNTTMSFSDSNSALSLCYSCHYWKIFCLENALL